MTQFVQVFGKPQRALTIPDNFELIASNSQKRNREKVTVERYQAAKPTVMNGPHVTVIYGRDGRLISYNNFAVQSTADLPSDQEAITIATSVFEQLDSKYASGLSYMRIDRLSRYYIDEAGHEIDIPILWVKFAHKNGSYNWVSVGAGGKVIEVERESKWDYWRSRRATEEWNYDDWVLARNGMGPQPSSPEALA